MKAEIQDNELRIAKRVEREKVAMKKAVQAAAMAEQVTDAIREASVEDQISPAQQAYNDEIAKSVEESIKKLDDELTKEIQWAHRFYTIKSKKGGLFDIVFNLLGILDVLKELGFYRYDDPGINSDQSIYIQIHDGKIQAP